MKGNRTRKPNAAVLWDWTLGFAFSLERMKDQNVTATRLTKVRNAGTSCEIRGIKETFITNPAKVTTATRVMAADIDLGLRSVYSRMLWGPMENISERLFWRRRMPDRTPVPRNRNGICYWFT